jgi:hypothetical protein
MHTHDISNGIFLCQPTLAPIFGIPIPLCMNQPFPLLTWRSLFNIRDANTHPLSSLVSYQLSLPCCLTHPEDTP